MQFARMSGFVKWGSVTVRLSLPWSGSVTAQQPISGAPPPHRELLVTVRDPEADCESRVAPPHLLADECPDLGPLDRQELHGCRLQVVQADLAVLLEDIPEDGVRRDHVELHPLGCLQE